MPDLNCEAFVVQLGFWARMDKIVWNPSLSVRSTVAIVLFTANVLFELGIVRMERVIVYPVVVWAIGFGGYLINSETGPALVQPFGGRSDFATKPLCVLQLKPMWVTYTR